MLQESSRTKEDIIVTCGVKFMTEAAYILNPNKKVIVPDINLDVL
ncbi:quinolinate synthase NadA [bacterium]|nr:quinolinate synthase NadA [bacterium]